MAHHLELQESDAAELFVWTDIDPTHEDDFNRWYDREHMEERVAIPGFHWARRYRATSTGTPRYLALYRAESLAVFTSAAYQQAFEHQTPWSVANFERMFNTQRRVMRVTLEAGIGCGAALGVIVLHSARVDRPRLMAAMDSIDNWDGVLRIHCLEPDTELSAPLPSEDPAQRRLDATLVIDTTAESIAIKTVGVLREALGLDANRGTTLNLMWSLAAQDVPRHSRESGNPAS